MADLRISSRYARALFDLALGEQRLDSVLADLEGLLALQDRSPDFARLLQDPSLPQAKVQAALQALFEGRLEALTLRFLRFLAERRRLGELPGIIRRFGALCDRQRGQLRVAVTSAQPLTGAQQDELAERIGRRHGKKIIAQYGTDPRLVGGFRYQVGDAIHDYSIATALESFKQKLINV